ncbi:BhlA/UviB family holin-like peptide [Priestia megaterium]|uniref:BhlA/UviB family holin-like peptide n=1 Tax=Priestia megaterium TaxID=1404 RepID=UPI002D7EB2EF|nr:BhlA/UviB family holin-like peptide [Priestia megaterium]MEB4861163.1 BhlA/UviB family holin-like peptide [Priestia megaterium]
MDQLFVDVMTKGGVEGIFGILFIWLLMSTRKEAREEKADSKQREKESKEREDKLISHLNRTTETLQKIEQSITCIPIIEQSIFVMKEEIRDIREKIEK